MTAVAVKALRKKPSFAHAVFSDRAIVKGFGFVVRPGLGSLRSQVILLHDDVRG